MEHKHVLGAGIILALIVAGMFVFAYLKKTELEQAPQEEQVNEQTATPYDSITRIDAKHFFIDGVHTLVGEIIMPTSCDLLNWDTQIAESMPEQVTVHFDVVNHTETCAQGATPQRFKISVTASENATFRAKFMNRDIEINLIPATEGEDPEDFELFLKG